MPKRAVHADWTQSLPHAPHCSAYSSLNEHVSKDGFMVARSHRENEDRVYFSTHQGTELLMVLDGHDGLRAVDFVLKQFPYLLFRSQLDGGSEMVRTAIRKCFLDTEKDFFVSIDLAITKKLTLQFEINQLGLNSAAAFQHFPNQVSEIQQLDDEIKGGTSVVAALIYDKTLYVANVGDCRCLLCYTNEKDNLMIEQLSDDHTVSNDGELRRLEDLGLDRTQLRHIGRLGMHQNTRSIGDYSIKGGYRDVDILKHATEEPGSPEPHISRGFDLSSIRQGFLVLMSDGLYSAYQVYTGNPHTVNKDIAFLIKSELEKQQDFDRVAQNVVDIVRACFKQTCKAMMRNDRMDDISLLIRCLPYPSSFRRAHSIPHPPPPPLQHSGLTPSTAPSNWSTSMFDFSQDRLIGHRFPSGGDPSDPRHFSPSADAPPTHPVVAEPSNSAMLQQGGTSSEVLLQAPETFPRMDSQGHPTNDTSPRSSLINMSALPVSSVPPDVSTGKEEEDGDWEEEEGTTTPTTATSRTVNQQPVDSEEQHQEDEGEEEGEKDLYGAEEEDETPTLKSDRDETGELLSLSSPRPSFSPLGSLDSGEGTHIITVNRQGSVERDSSSDGEAEATDDGEDDLMIPHVTFSDRIPDGLGWDDL